MRIIVISNHHYVSCLHKVNGILFLFFFFVFCWLFVVDVRWSWYSIIITIQYLNMRLFFCWFIIILLKCGFLQKNLLYYVRASEYIYDKFILRLVAVCRKLSLICCIYNMTHRRKKNNRVIVGFNSNSHSIFEVHHMISFKPSPVQYTLHNMNQKVLPYLFM